MSVKIADVTKEIATQLNISQKDARNVLDVVTGVISTLAAQDSVRVPEFGTFATKTTKARKGRNPQTGAEIEVPAKTRLTFKAAK